MVVLPLMGRHIPIIADAYVDREFGTGALKVTPAHDFNDFELARKHQLEHVRVIGEDGTMTEAAGAYAGMDRYAARKKILKDLAAAGLLVKTENHKNRVGHCYRCKSVVEPMQSLQWFVATKSLADAAMEAVRDGRTHIVPRKMGKGLFHLARIRLGLVREQADLVGAQDPCLVTAANAGTPMSVSMTR